MKLISIAVVSLGLLCSTVYAAESNLATTPTQTIAVDKNKAAGEAFLMKNKKNKGVVTLPSGLQYKIIKKGTGPKPSADDEVTVNYVGTLINGTEFDSSKPHQPITFGVKQVIAGWTEALQLMPMGSIWMLYIPSELAYQDQSVPPFISPNSTLIFKVELVGVQNKHRKNV